MDFALESCARVLHSLGLWVKPYPFSHFSTVFRLHTTLNTAHRRVSRHPCRPAGAGHTHSCCQRPLLPRVRRASLPRFLSPYVVSYQLSMCACAVSCQTCHGTVSTEKCAETRLLLSCRQGHAMQHLLGAQEGAARRRALSISVLCHITTQQPPELGTAGFTSSALALWKKEGSTPESYRSAAHARL